MRKLSQLITQSRRATENISFDDVTGIGDEEFIQYGNDAQERLQSIISTANDELFQEEAIITMVSGQEEYDIPADALLTTRLQNIQYSDNGGSNYYVLPQLTMKNRIGTNVDSNLPAYYIRKSDKILIQPVPSSGGQVRIIYQQRLPKIDKRRALIKSVVLGSGNTITSLFFDTTQNIDSSEIKEEGYITVVDKDGVIKMKAIPVQDVNTTSGEVTVYAGFTYEDGETITASDYAVLGKNASTHSQMPDTCERYFIAYMNWKILKRDSSNDSSEQNSELKEIESDIISAFSEADQDVDYVPILDGNYGSIEDDDWY